MIKKIFLKKRKRVNKDEKRESQVASFSRSIPGEEEENSWNVQINLDKTELLSGELGQTPASVSLGVCCGRCVSAGRSLCASATRILAEVGRSDDVFSGFDGNH